MAVCNDGFFTDAHRVLYAWHGACDAWWKFSFDKRRQQWHAANVRQCRFEWNKSDDVACGIDTCEIANGSCFVEQRV